MKCHAVALIFNISSFFVAYVLLLESWRNNGINGKLGAECREKGTHEMGIRTPVTTQTLTPHAVTLGRKCGHNYSMCPHRNDSSGREMTLLSGPPHSPGGKPAGLVASDASRTMMSSTTASSSTLAVGQGSIRPPSAMPNDAGPGEQHTQTGGAQGVEDEGPAAPGPGGLLAGQAVTTTTYPMRHQLRPAGLRWPSASAAADRYFQRASSLL